jgi:Plavaka transposase
MLQYCFSFSSQQNQEEEEQAFQTFSRQLYHACIARIFAPLKRKWNESPRDCARPSADGHFRRAIYSIGPVIADYPEQVWLTCVVQDCKSFNTAFYITFTYNGLLMPARCFAKPSNFLDDPVESLKLRSHEQIDWAILCFDPGILWSQRGIREDVVVRG